jgi:hypothetical protein
MGEQFSKALQANTEATHELKSAVVELTLSVQCMAEKLDWLDRAVAKEEVQSKPLRMGRQ